MHKIFLQFSLHKGRIGKPLSPSLYHSSHLASAVVLRGLVGVQPYTFVPISRFAESRDISWASCHVKTVGLWKRRGRSVFMPHQWSKLSERWRTIGGGSGGCCVVVPVPTFAVYCWRTNPSPRADADLFVTQRSQQS